MRIWFTGEAGFLAKSFTKWCKKYGHQVVNSLEEDYYDYWRQSINSSKEKEINIFDPTLKTLIEKSGAEVIIHGAAVIDEEEINLDPEYTIKINIEGTARICKIARELEIP